jgi:acyl carrier protein
MTGTLDRLRTVVWRTFGELVAKEISSDTSLFGRGLGLDSVGAMELVLAVEEEFGIVVDESELAIEDVGTLGAIVRLVESKVNNGSHDR